jgi:hypothetical protein
MAGAPLRTTCKGLSEQLEILPVASQYMVLSLMNFIISNQKNVQTSSSIQNVHARNKHRLHRPNADLSCVPKSTFCDGIRIFNSSPLSVAILKNARAAVRKYPHTHTRARARTHILLCT